MTPEENDDDGGGGDDDDYDGIGTGTKESTTYTQCIVDRAESNLTSFTINFPRIEIIKFA